MNNSLKYDLDKAKKELNELQGELPHFHALLTDNEQDAQRLREQRASLDAQSQARGRVQIAKEMLEQHQADIQSAQAEVARLEALRQREQKLAQMARAAATAKMHREAMDEAFSDVTKAMHRATELLLREWRAESEARQEFAQVGTEVVAYFNLISNYPGDLAGSGLPGHEREALSAQIRNLVGELSERGAPVDYALDKTTGNFANLDSVQHPFERDELSLLL